MTTSSVTPIQESATEHLRNALQILIPDSTAAMGYHRERDIIAARGRILKALDQLGAPNVAMVEAMRKTLAYHQTMPESHEPASDYTRYVEDCCAIVLRAQVNGWTP